MWGEAGAIQLSVDMHPEVYASHDRQVKCKNSWRVCFGFRQCYNGSDMKSVKSTVVRLPVLLLLLTLLLPTFGVLADHHFAERQPSHLHIGAYGDHLHLLDASHAHYQGAVPSNAGNQQPPSAIYNYDGALTIAIGVAMVGTRIDTVAEFEPTSLYVFPLPHYPRARTRYVSPAERPPPPLL